ncbi:MAG: orotidine-5'-phosphate decarboxylase [Terriglobales bacterium]
MSAPPAPSGTFVPIRGKDRLILALDVPTRAAALDLVRRLGPEVGRVKVGLELFTAEGPALVRELSATGTGVFLDLKLHDIPNTVAGAVRSAAGLGAQMLSVHAAGGEAMLRAAAAARDAAIGAAACRLQLLGITVLTSLDQATLEALAMPGPVESRVVAWARLCQRAGLDGVVCSAREAAAVRAACGPPFLIVTPGIRPASAPTQDQARAATAAEARRQGADFLVVGRAVNRAADPVAVARQLAAEAG